MTASIPKRGMTRWSIVILALAGIAAAFFWGLSRLQITSDLARILPKTDKVVADTLYVIGRHPIIDKVFIDLSLAGGRRDPDFLVAAAGRIERRLRGSGLFAQVGLGPFEGTMARLVTRVVDSLPGLFDGPTLQKRVLPLIAPAAVEARMAANLKLLRDLSGVGQTGLIARDPLGLRNIILARLARTFTLGAGRIYKGRIMSGDLKHLLVVADPRSAGTDTSVARKIADLFNRISSQWKAAGRTTGRTLIVTPVGAYRSALDNENIIRRDAMRAVLVATIGIALLLLVSFPRPFIGLLALVPAVFGAALALFIYSLFRDQISGLALGFGGALISISVDHAVAYLLFLDRTTPTSSHEAAAKVRAVGLYAVLTTVGALLAMGLSGFTLLWEIGLFAALGVACSFAIVHTLFPLLLSGLGPAKRAARLPVERFLSGLAGMKSSIPVVVLAVFGLIMLVLAKPDFHIDLKAMNTVTRATQEAEKSMAQVWKKAMSQTYVFVEAAGRPEMSAKTDRLARWLDREVAEGRLAGVHSPLLVLPGPLRLKRNLAAWRAFWTPDRLAELKRSLALAAGKHGFSEDAWRPFLLAARHPQIPVRETWQGLDSILGIFHSRGGRDLVSLVAVKPGPAFQASSFLERADRNGFRVLDTDLFTTRLGRLLASVFGHMLALIAAAVVVLLIILYLDLRLTAITLAPLAFALVSTLGTLKLLGRPLDIPALMLGVVVFGMGVDYSLFLVRAYQRFGADGRSSLGPVMTTIGLAGGSTLIGLLSLSLAQHAVLRSAGIISMLGIGYCLVGAFVILPPLLRRLFAPRPWPVEKFVPGSSRHRALTRARYRHLDVQARMFVRFKLALDPMFPRLYDFVPARGTILDVGCGYGIQAAWLMAVHPDLEIRGIEPDPARASLAARALAPRGGIEVKAAPDLPADPARVEAILFLDVAHYLTDHQLKLTLTGMAARLAPGGRLVMRVTIPGADRVAWQRRLENFKTRLRGQAVFWRGAAEIDDFCKGAGLRVTMVEPTAPRREETWFVAGIDDRTGGPGEPDR